MLNILLATTRPEAMQPFTEALSSDPEVHLDQVASSVDVLAAVRAFAPHLVVIDSSMPDTDPLSLIPKLLRINAMVNTAVISPLSEKEFHEASEGLGVLSRVPVVPDRSDAVALLVKLRSILGVMG